MKQKTVFVCKECGYEAVKWLGKCPSCETFMSFIEEKAEKTSIASENVKKTQLKKIEDITMENEERPASGSVELDRVLGGGIVKGSLVLCGGEPGIGKSTLLLQVAAFCAKSDSFSCRFATGTQRLPLQK